MCERYLRGIRMKNEVPDNSYLKNLDVIKNLDKMDMLRFDTPVTFFVGENGVGKSTLIEAIAVACGFNAEGGTKNFCFETTRTHSDLYKHIVLEKGAKRQRDGFFLRAESFYNFASTIDMIDDGESDKIIDNYGGVSLHKQSHGESFLATIKNRFGDGLYILDEPEAALSPKGIMRLIANIHQLVKKGAQFVISTHSAMLLTYPYASIYEITKKGISLVPYEQTEHFELTKTFLNNPQHLLKYLIEE